MDGDRGALPSTLREADSSIQYIRRADYELR